MADAKIAVFCPVYKNPELIAAQIDNYYSFHGDSAFHVLHLAHGADPGFLEIHRLIQAPVIVHINQDSWHTSYRCILGSVLSNHAFLKRNSIDYSHVYLHTDGDLLFSGDLTQTVAEAENGFSAGLLHLCPHWTHYQASQDNVHISKMTTALGLTCNDVYFGRQEGSFFAAQVWEKIAGIALEAFPKSYFADTSSHWPAEEVVIPTLAKHFLGKDYSHSRNLIYTKEIKNSSRTSEENVVQEKDILNLIAHATVPCYGMKWFSHNLDHPSRQLVKSLAHG